MEIHDKSVLAKETAKETAERAECTTALSRPAKCNRALNWPIRRGRNVAILVVVMLSTHALLLAWGAYRHSPTSDEIGHLVAGVSHWHLGRFDLYRVNPPLVRTVASLPVVALGPRTDWDNWIDSPKARSEFPLGDAFIEMNGAKSFWYFTLARWACIPFSLIGALVCYAWATELYGVRSGIFALCLWCFSPNIIGHAQLMTPDVGAAALGTAAIYMFWKWLRRFDWPSVYSTAIALGLAVSAKATWIILFALLPLGWLAWQAASGASSTRQVKSQHAGQMFAILLAALLVLNTVYLFEGSFQRLGDYLFSSRTLSGTTQQVHVQHANAMGNRFRNTILGYVPVPLPRNFVQGVDLQKWDFEKNKYSYLRGEVRHGGWWYYYLYALLVKVPLGTWLLVILAGVDRFSDKNGVSTFRHELILFLPLAILIFLASNQTGINKHLRYVLPVFPLLFILTSRVVRSIEGKRSWCFSMLVAIGLVGSVTSSLMSYPHSLAYFNEWSGGPRNGSFHLLSSNIAWGQDLLFMKRWLVAHPEARPLQLAAQCGFDPQTAGIEFTLPPTQPVEKDHFGTSRATYRPRPGWYAVDANILRGYPCIIPDGNGGRVWVDERDFAYFQDLQPAVRIGYSIFIYEVKDLTNE